MQGGLTEGIPFAHSRRPSLVGSEGYFPTPLSCGYGEQQAATGNTLRQPCGTIAFLATRRRPVLERVKGTDISENKFSMQEEVVEGEFQRQEDQLSRLGD